MSATDAPTQLESDLSDTAGARLRSAREQLDLSLREVAADLNLMVSHVRGMETDRCAHLTNDKVFLRHMRSYATLVTIDADELIELYRSQSAAAEAAIQALPSKRFKVLHRLDGNWFAVAVLALACVSLGIWSLNQTSPVTVKVNTATSISQTARKNPAAEPETAGKDLIEVTAANKPKAKPNADITVSTINVASETSAVTVDGNRKPTEQTSAPPAAKTVARSDQTTLASAPKASRNSSESKAQYKNALRSLGAKPLRKTLIELKTNGAEQNES